MPSGTSSAYAVAQTVLPRPTPPATELGRSLRAARPYARPQPTPYSQCIVFVTIGTCCFVRPRPLPTASAAFLRTCAGGGASPQVRGTGTPSGLPRAFATASWYAVIVPVPATPATSPRPTAPMRDARAISRAGIPTRFFLQTEPHARARPRRGTVTPSARADRAADAVGGDRRRSPPMQM